MLINSSHMIIILTYQTMLLTSADHTASVNNNSQSCNVSELELSSTTAERFGPLVKMMDRQAFILHTELWSWSLAWKLFFWDVTPCDLLDRYQRFGGTLWLHIKGGRKREQVPQIIRPQIQEDTNLLIHSRENLGFRSLVCPVRVLQERVCLHFRKITYKFRKSQFQGESEYFIPTPSQVQIFIKPQPFLARHCWTDNDISQRCFTEKMT